MRTVLVTGGTVRLGKAIADHLRAAGWRVLTSSHRPGSGADIIADLSEPMGAAKLYAGCINLLGGNPPDAALFTGDEAAMASVNLEAPRKLVMMMAGREDGRGKVVNILDTRVLSQPAEDAYGRTKRDLMEWSAKAAAMFADTLNVNSVAPGPVLAPVDVHEAAGECPLGRPTPEAVARAVGFLLEADYTSGCVIPVDGGRSL